MATLPEWPRCLDAIASGGNPQDRAASLLEVLSANVTQHYSNAYLFSSKAPQVAPQVAH
ncbi:MAG: hypothetical protein F6J90_39965 [Moorea sp. SIOASIH]|uniref:hypothetical protein n=1 Tax=Moorena sp. SIOASIH TaxID=2607817 RepID=UPI0013B7FA1F|nr:hypothetical protein [Moorena sp. SIOASIH]NEO42170.1 hypothetical protein [Moorena sp. SIOASIH]